MKRITIIGGGGHAKVIISILKKLSTYEIVGYVDVENKGDVLGVKYLGSDDNLVELKTKYKIDNAVIGIGQIKNISFREKIVRQIQEIGFNFPTIISPNAIINESVEVGVGTVIMDGVVINPTTRIGKFCIINTKSTVEHDCKIGNFCHIATGAVLSGGVEVGNFSMIGSNAVVVQYKKITSKCMIGAGCVVTKDITEEGVYVGNPARKIK